MTLLEILPEWMDLRYLKRAQVTLTESQEARFDTLSGMLSMITIHVNEDREYEVPEMSSAVSDHEAWQREQEVKADIARGVRTEEVPAW